MGDVNPMRTIRDYSRPSHEGYRNIIKLPEGNNVEDEAKESAKSSATEYKDHEMTVESKEEFEDETDEESEEEEEDNPEHFNFFPTMKELGESHETFQCQPMDQNVDFSGSNQIQTLQYPEIHLPSQEISDKVFHAKRDLMKSIQTFLKEFNYIPFEEKPQILLQAWYKFFTIQHAQPENSNELFQKLLEDLKELAEYKESLENSSNEIAASNSNQEKEGPPQDSDMR
nr:hypothetical protein [Tanacetum cinerariifolium]